ncbi:MAG: M15 family metallopeptidase [candidate division KSB1 bacterium]|nr:M15 family metallopeptidase [candidate division KSB1 bacterium]MDZ7303805.1 M15 family metallopeptidase [candidate division KSB1 bacterium]MDZ7312203.1 M15 family metallopeptidase [candidate division KSB1 bacterium]
MRITIMKTIAILFCFFLPALAFSQSSDRELVDLTEIIPDIVLDLKYATPDNFLHEKLYTVGRAYLALGAAKSLKIVQDSLRARGLGLKIWDAYRPLSVQWLMWEKLPDSRYVADPRSGSRHNRGAAVDVTLVDLATGKELEMPTGFDDFTGKASHDYMNLPDQVIKNRQLLKDLMVRVGGFSAYSEEWWHYTHIRSQNYPLLDFQMK